MVFFSEAGVVWLSSGTRRIMDKRVVRKYSAISINSKARIMDTRVADIYVKGRIYAINKIAMLTGDNIKCITFTVNKRIISLIDIKKER